MQAQKIADPMDYDEDEQFEGLFLTVQMEAKLGEKLMVDVPAKQFQEFKNLLGTDLFNEAREKGIEILDKFSFVPVVGDQQ